VADKIRTANEAKINFKGTLTGFAFWGRTPGAVGQKYHKYLDPPMGIARTPPESAQM
jgi:hypothetical protein